MAVYGDWDVMYHLAYALLLIGIGCFAWAHLNVRLTDFRRTSRGLRAQVGGPFDERVEVRNRSWLPKPWVEIVDHSTLPGHSISRALALGPWERRMDSTRSICRQRGRFQIGPVLMASGDPFGLFRVTRQVAGEQTVVVYPAIVELPAFGS